MHRCGPNCGVLKHLRKIALLRANPVSDEIIPVKSWCRVCGVPVLLEVMNSYDMAVRHFYALDDTPMVHKAIHAETSGWGVHWRLDDVLATVFPHQHPIDELYWPMPPWWIENYGEPQSEDQGILILSQSQIDNYEDEHMDLELHLLSRYLRDNPRDAAQLEGEYGEVWSAEDVGEDFEILGFKSPFAIAKCRKTGQRGSLVFQNNPRFYFGWDPERVI